MSDNYPTVPRELSWLDFNERVLQEAADTSVPLIERIRFLGIFSNNLDEFFRVRVADLRRKIALTGKTLRGTSDDERLLREIQKRVVQLQESFHQHFFDIKQALAIEKIHLIDETQLKSGQAAFVRNYFRQSVLPILVPILIDEARPFPSLVDQSIYLATRLTNRHGGKATHRFAVIDVPTHRLSRFLIIPGDKAKGQFIILLDDVIRFCLEDVFQGIIPFTSVVAYTIKLTRDAELTIGDGISESLLDKMTDSLKDRSFGLPTRLVYDKEMPTRMLRYFTRRLGFTDDDVVIPGDRYHNFKDFIGFPNVTGKARHEHAPIVPLASKRMDSESSIFATLKKQDVLLYYPYHDFSYFVHFLRQAALDPDVTTIYVSIYRVAKGSKVVNCLINAALNQKQVRVNVELQARFDEEANIEWSKRLTDAGVKVSFGVPGLKVHSKLALIKRREGESETRYAHVGTGNFHEGTAMLYTDFSLFTHNDEVTREVERVFDFISSSYRQYAFKHLIVSPISTRTHFGALIGREIANARIGKPAGFFAKINNLADNAMINELYLASQAGVKIRMIIRGMCCLVPGIPGVSENIEAISVVDRLLEHPRVYIFMNAGDPEIYISSADLMTRNIDHRVEVSVPIYEPELKQQIIDIMNIQWNDTLKARCISMQNNNKHVERGSRRKLRSQVAIYDYLAAVEKGNKKEISKILDNLQDIMAP